MVGLTDSIVKIVSAFKPININVKKIEQKFSIGGKEITAEKYVENSGKFSFTQRPELLKLDEKELDKKLFEKTDGFVNVELLQQEVVTTKLFFTKGIIIRKYRNLLFEKDLSAVLLAYSVCSYEDNKKRDEAHQGKENLMKIYKKRGRTIYNFVRSSLFETDILKELDNIKKENKDPLQSAKKFGEYFESIILFHPTKMYVSVGWSADDLLSEVSTRFQNMIREQKTKELFIYSRSTNMNTVNKFKEIESVKDTFDIKDCSYFFGEEKAKTTILTIKNAK